jgi:hypothetical protein
MIRKQGTKLTGLSEDYFMGHRERKGKPGILNLM